MGVRIESRRGVYREEEAGGKMGLDGGEERKGGRERRDEGTRVNEE